MNLYFIMLVIAHTFNKSLNYAFLRRVVNLNRDWSITLYIGKDIRKI